MNKLFLLCIMLLLGTSVMAQDLYVRGDHNGWGTDNGGPIVDDGSNGDAVAGDNIYSFTITYADPGRYEWKIADADWATIFPFYGGDDNAWVYTTVANQEVVFTLDMNTYDDEFEPNVNIVNASDQYPTPSADIVAVGDHNGWNNAGTEVMHDDGLAGDWEAGDGVYAFSFEQATAGTYSWKPVMTGTWDTWAAGGRTKNSANLQYITGTDNEMVYCYINLNTGRVATVMGEPLPVELTSFNARVSGNNVSLVWATATELNNSGFEVERRTENSDWTKIGFVDGNGTSAEVNKYSFNDAPALSGTYFYRLKQVDFDGSFEYSGYVSVEVEIPVEFNLAQNYPNPFNPSTTISFSLPEKANVNITIYDITGKIVNTLVSNGYAAGNHAVKFNAADLSSGMYIYKLNAVAESNKVYNAAGKMLLMK